MIQNSLHGAPFSFVRGSKNNRFVLWCSHHRLLETKKKSDTKEDANFTQQGVEEESVNRTDARTVASIDVMAGKQEYKTMAYSKTSSVSQYSDNHQHVRSIRKCDKKDCCNCRICFFIWPDGFFYLDHTTTNLSHTGHPEFTLVANQKGKSYRNEQSELLCDQSKDEIRKNIIMTVDQVLSLRVPAVIAKRFEEKALKELKEMESRLAEYKRELFEELATECPTGGSMKNDRSLVEFGCDENKGDRKEKKKRNGLDY
jgi:Fe-S-cluster-containing hydrogenase component 2